VLKSQDDWGRWLAWVSWISRIPPAWGLPGRLRTDSETPILAQERADLSAIAGVACPPEQARLPVWIH
jgi:hypothetical protein